MFFPYSRLWLKVPLLLQSAITYEILNMMIEMKKEFTYLLKFSEKVAKKLWNNEEDKIWNHF